MAIGQYLGNITSWDWRVRGVYYITSRCQPRAGEDAAPYRYR